MFTEASCYLEWIADSYDMQLGKGYGTGCRGESGDREDVDREDCQAGNGKKCIFDAGVVFSIFDTGFQISLGGNGTEFNQCILGAQDQIGVQMWYFCYTFDSADALSKCCSEDIEKCDEILGISTSEDMDWLEVAQENLNAFIQLLKSVGLVMMMQ